MKHRVYAPPIKTMHCRDMKFLWVKHNITMLPVIIHPTYDNKDQFISVFLQTFEFNH